MGRRWECESEGLTRRVNPKTGRPEWVEIMPECHGPMRPDWLRCADCGFACRHWTCRECEREDRDPRHVCQSFRAADPHRR